MTNQPMKKSELKQIIKEEIRKAVYEGGPFDALGSAYGAFQSPKPTPKREPLTINTAIKGEHFIITNDKEWYAGGENNLRFTKNIAQATFYPTYNSAQKALFDEIPDDIVKSKQFRVQRYK